MINVMAKILTITYIPETETVQVAISFEYKGKTEFALAIVDLTKETLPTDFIEINKSKAEIPAFAKAINDKIDLIEDPEQLL